MKVAVLILAVLAASASAGLFDGPNAAAAAQVYINSFVSIITIEISAMTNGFIAAISVIINILIQVGATSVTYVTNWGISGATLLITVTADAAELGLYIASTLVSVTIGQAISAPYTALVASIQAQVAIDIIALPLQVVTGKVKYSCVVSEKIYIDGNITEFQVLVQKKRAEHDKKIKDKSDALQKQINDDFAAFQQNITATCSNKGSKEAGCDVDQYLVLRPDMKKKQKGYVDQAKKDADDNKKDAEDNATALKADFQARYTLIQQDIIKCSKA